MASGVFQPRKQFNNIQNQRSTIKLRGIHPHWPNALRIVEFVGTIPLPVIQFSVRFGIVGRVTENTEDASTALANFSSENLCPMNLNFLVRISETLFLLKHIKAWPKCYVWLVRYSSTWKPYDPIRTWMGIRLYQR